MQLKKDAHKLSEPHLLISVVGQALMMTTWHCLLTDYCVADRKGRLIEAVQRTPDAQVDGQMLIFDYVINVDTNL